MPIFQQGYSPTCAAFSTVYRADVAADPGRLRLLHPSSQLEQIRQRGEIRVGTIYGPTSYYQRDDTAQGFDYELAQSYADWLGSS